MLKRLLVLTLFAAGGAASLPLTAAQHPQMPAGMTHEEHLTRLQKDADVRKRGALAMGFDQDATAHHFMLTADGGAIDVAVHDARDGASREAVRSHLREIARQFAGGVFDKPFATHAEVPAGVPALQRLRGAIDYVYEATRDGARVRIRTANSEALAAIHEFLRYQIKEHGTRDSTSIRK